MAAPQENSLFVEQAGKPVLENGARCTLKIDRPVTVGLSLI